MTDDAPARGGAGTTLSTVIRAARTAAMYAFAFRVSRALTRPTTAPTGEGTSSSASSLSTGATAATSPYAAVCSPTYARGEPVDVRVYVRAEANEAESRARFRASVDETPALRVSGVGLGTETVDTRELDLSAHEAVVEAVRKNLTLRMYAVVSRRDRTIFEEDETYDARDVLVASVDVTTRRRKKIVKTRKLLGAKSSDEGETVTESVDDGVEDEGEEDAARETVMTYFKPNATLTVVDDFVAYNPTTLPDILASQMRFTDERRSSYDPTVYFNEFWMIKSYLRQFNETSAATLKVNFNFEVLSQLRWQMYTSMEQSWKTQRDFGAAGENDADNIKRVFLEGNPVLLAVTSVVSLLHTVFDFLAFKNDVVFWKNRKSMEGLSGRSVVFNAACQLIIFLYLCDNETSWMILMSSGMGTAIEFWKVTKAMDVDIVRPTPTSLPRLRIKPKQSSLKSETARHDADAMRYMSYVLYPLCAVYAVYSLRTHEHKGWYSFVLNSLVGAVYTFGFIAMTPQLYINYKLKSVAAMPWKQMGYKFLNTIIDDLFAFVIKMPTLHRISVFRDDVIFLLFLYQRRIYRIDASRVNEFGYAAEPTEDETPKDAEDEPSETDEIEESKKDR